MIDFTNCIEVLNNYKGSEKKKTLLYNGKKYLVKFPDPVREKNKDLSYINNAFSEYVGSHIFKIVGMEVQNTLLGTYIYNGKEKIVCACEDFTDSKKRLYEFESLALSANPDKKIETELNDILEVLNGIAKVDSEKSIVNFFDMFIVDALIGNTDRHNGNWGFIIDEENDVVTFAPIYDCGSCLNPLLDDESLGKMRKTELKNLAVNSYSCFKEVGKKINYISYLQECKNQDCNKALLRIIPKINIEEINAFIEEIPCMSDARKSFYKKIIEIRYEILKEIYDSLI